MATVSDIPGGLGASPLFKGLPDEELEKLIGAVRGRSRTYQAGSLIAQTGDQITSLSMVLEGRVRGEMMDQGGRVVRIEDIAAPRVLAPAFIFDRDPAYPVDLVADDQVTLFFIPKEDLLWLMQEERKILENFLGLVSGRGRFLSGKIRLLSLSNLKGRLAFYLLEQWEQKGKGQFRLEHSQGQLAELFGVARPSLARSLGELRREGLIAASGREIEVLDQQGLRSLIDEPNL